MLQCKSRIYLGNSYKTIRFSHKEGELKCPELCFNKQVLQQHFTLHSRRISIRLYSISSDKGFITCAIYTFKPTLRYFYFFFLFYSILSPPLFPCNVLWSNDSIIKGNVFPFNTINRTSIEESGCDVPPPYRPQPGNYPEYLLSG